MTEEKIHIINQLQRLFIRQILSRVKLLPLGPLDLPPRPPAADTREVTLTIKCISVTDTLDDIICFHLIRVVKVNQLFSHMWRDVTFFVRGCVTCFSSSSSSSLSSLFHSLLSLSMLRRMRATWASADGTSTKYLADCLKLHATQHLTIDEVHDFFPRLCPLCLCFREFFFFSFFSFLPSPLTHTLSGCVDAAQAMSLTNRDAFFLFRASYCSLNFHIHHKMQL